MRPLPAPRIRRTSRAVSWLAPAAAVIAVAGVIAGVSLAGAHNRGSSSGSQSKTRQPIDRHMPRYYVTVFQRYTDGGYKITTTAAVHDSATGAALAAVPVPTLTSQGATSGASISAAADDRTFVITETGGSGPDHNLVRFYELRVTPNGRSASLTRLPIKVPGSLAVDTAALSPDGTRLAMQEQSCYQGGCYYTGIRVVTIATGAVRTWTTRANGAPFEVSWAGNSTVAFQWDQGYRLLSVTGAGGNLLAGPAIASPPAEPTHYIPAALVTPDGRIVVTSTVRNIPDGRGRDTVIAKILELSARTGKQLRVLRTVIMRGVKPGIGGEAGNLDQGCNVLSLGPAGLNVLVECYSFGRVGGGAFTSLPGFPSPSSSGISRQSAAAW
jgi:hypothetical protein